ncbi:MAG TPA: hypothetical protein VFD84_07975 [Candidatus Binatia bacterium]|jgi:hypothetical protein|nr:hypothetical protein [Candidatus Binatia bacterium]
MSITRPLALAVVVGIVGALAVARDAEPRRMDFTFTMVPSSAAIRACLPTATATVTLRDTRLNQIMKVRARGLAPNTGYDLFVNQVPHGPFGVSWYQSDLQTDARGNGEATVRGIFNKETFSISPGTVTTLGREGTPQTGATFGAVNQYHLGLWFNDPQVPFDLGCEPGQTAPVVTPFNGEQHAGIQVLNTSNFEDDDGPLKHFSPSGAFLDDPTP